MKIMATIKCKWSQYIISSRMVEVSRWLWYQKVYIFRSILLFKDVLKRYKTKIKAKVIKMYEEEILNELRKNNALLERLVKEIAGRSFGGSDFNGCLTRIMYGVEH